MVTTLVCTKPGTLEIQQWAKPVARAGQVLLKVKRVGICGTDIHAFSGNQPFFEYPRVLGHEISGIIESVGSDVTLTPGRHAYVIPYIACGTCIACRRQRGNCCANIKVLGVHTDGGLCEYLEVPAEYVVTAEGLELDQLAVVECLAIGAHAVRRAAIQPDATVLVVGAGPIGMGVLQFAKIQGARVMMLDTNRERLEFCHRQLGADAVVEAGAEAQHCIAALTNGDYPEVIFDATGNPRAMEAGFKLLAHGGTYVLVSVINGEIRFDDPEFHKRETSLLGSRNATREDFEHVVDCLRDGRVRVNAMISHRATLTELPALLAEWSRPDAGVIKAVIEV